MNFWERVLLRHRQRRLKYWGQRVDEASRRMLEAHKDKRYAYEMTAYYSKKLEEMLGYTPPPPPQPPVDGTLHPIDPNYPKS